MPMNVLNDIKIGQELFYDKSTYMQELNKINIMEKLKKMFLLLVLLYIDLISSDLIFSLMLRNYTIHVISFTCILNRYQHSSELFMHIQQFLEHLKWFFISALVTVIQRISF